MVVFSNVDKIYLFTEVVIGVLAIFGNGIVLLGIIQYRSLHTSTNYFIGSLAAADILVGVCIPPAIVLTRLGLPREFVGCVAINSLIVLITNISVLSLLGVAFDRFWAIRSPFLYQSKMSRGKALIVIAIIWAVAILIGFIPNMGWHKDPTGFTECSFPAVMDLNYMVYLIFFGLHLPQFVAMFGIYMYIFSVIYKQTQQIEQITRHLTTKKDRKRARKRGEEFKGAKALAYVIILFAACWLPIHLMNTITLLSPEIHLPFEWVLIAMVVSHAHSIVNPILYAYSNTKIKLAMTRMLCCGDDEQRKLLLQSFSQPTATASSSSRYRKETVMVSSVKMLLKSYPDTTVSTTQTNSNIRESRDIVPQPIESKDNDQGLKHESISFILNDEAQGVNTATSGTSPNVNQILMLQSLESSSSFSITSQGSIQSSATDTNDQEIRQDTVKQTDNHGLLSHDAVQYGASGRGAAKGSWAQNMKTAPGSHCASVDQPPSPKLSEKLSKQETTNLSPSHSDKSGPQLTQNIGRQTDVHGRGAPAQSTAGDSGTATVIFSNKAGARDLKTAVSSHYPSPPGISGKLSTHETTLNPFLSHGDKDGPKVGESKAKRTDPRTQFTTHDLKSAVSSNGRVVNQTPSATFSSLSMVRKEETTNLFLSLTDRSGHQTISDDHQIKLSTLKDMPSQSNKVKEDDQHRTKVKKSSVIYP